jgi:hypothetical protein
VRKYLSARLVFVGDKRVTVSGVAIHKFKILLLSLFIINNMIIIIIIFKKIWLYSIISLLKINIDMQE